jgi:hydrogenase maturation protease
MKNLETNQLVIIGIGNDGREDDGLGWRFLDLLEEKNCFDQIEYRFQLQIEDAELISGFKQVIFIDASKENIPEGYSFNRLEPEVASSFSTHAIPPAHILGLCNDLYDSFPEAYMLGIAGKQWELKTGLSNFAKENLDNAWEFFQNSVLEENLLVPS